jgi:hypothetical protein
MNTEPSDYVPDNNPQLMPQIPALNAWAFSVSWTNVPNMVSIKPPNPQFQPAPQVPYILPQTVVANSTEHGKSPIGLIQSRREPYAIDFYNNSYGLLSSRLGTNMGS